MCSQYISSDHEHALVDNGLKEWNYYRLQNLCDKITDGSHYSPREGGNGDYKIATVANMNYCKFNLNSCKSISKNEYDQLVKNGCKPETGDVLFSKDGTIGSSFVYRQDSNLVLLSSIAIISPNKRSLDPDFCSFMLKSSFVLGKIQDSKTGSAIKRIVLRDLKKVNIPCPPLPEQRKIAAILSSVDAAIEQTDAIIAQTERMKKSLIQELFTKGIGHSIFKKTSVGKNPNDWDVIYLGNKDYFNLETGGTPSTKITEYWERGEIPWLLSGEIHKKRIFNTKKKISQLGYDNSNATLLPKKSVLIALAGQGKTRGTAAITEIELTTNQSVAAIVSNYKYVCPYYVYYVLDSMYEELRSKSAGAGRAGLSLTILRELGLPFPSLPEQNQIAATLLSIDDKLSIEKDKHVHLKGLRKSLMQDLLTGKVRVKVDDHA